MYLDTYQSSSQVVRVYELHDLCRAWRAVDIFCIRISNRDQQIRKRTHVNTEQDEAKATDYCASLQHHQLGEIGYIRYADIDI